MLKRHLIYKCISVLEKIGLRFGISKLCKYILDFFIFNKIYFLEFDIELTITLYFVANMQYTNIV